MKLDPKKASIKNILAQKFTFAKACGLTAVLGTALTFSPLAYEKETVEVKDGRPGERAPVITYLGVLGLLAAGAGATGLMLEGLSKAAKKNETNLLDHMPAGRGSR